MVIRIDIHRTDRELPIRQSRNSDFHPERWVLTLCNSAKQTDWDTAGLFSGDRGKMCSLIPQKSFMRPSTTMGLPSDRVVRKVSSMFRPNAGPEGGGGGGGGISAGGGGGGTATRVDLLDKSST